MAAFIEKDPLTNVSTFVGDNEDDILRVHYSQDVEPVLEYNKVLRNDSLTDSGIKRDMWMYAKIPPVVIMKLKFEYGVDIFNREHYKRLFELLNGEFKYLKTTDLRHTVKT
jgi:hypothetical protein